MGLVERRIGRYRAENRGQSAIPNMGSRMLIPRCLERDTESAALKGAEALSFFHMRATRLLIVRRVFFIQRATERWPSGRRRSPAKGVGSKRASWVRIPSSPPVAAPRLFNLCRIQPVRG